MDFLTTKAALVPLALPLSADFKSQGAADADVATRLVTCLVEGPRGRADFGGPEVLTLGEMAEVWMEVRGVRKRLVQLSLAVAVAAGFRAGRNAAPEGAWTDPLARTAQTRGERG